MSSKKTDPALQTVVMRVVIPEQDIPMIQVCAEEVGATIIKFEDIGEDCIVVELMLESSFSLYALGKLVSYKELISKK